MQPVLQPASQQRELNSLSMVTVIVLLAAVTMTFGALIAVFMIRSTSPQFWGHIRMPSILGPLRPPCSPAVLSSKSAGIDLRLAINGAFSVSPAGRRLSGRCF